MTDKLYSLQDGARYLGVHPQSVKNRLAKGYLKGTFVGGVWVFTQQQLDESKTATPRSGRAHKGSAYAQIMDLRKQGHSLSQISRETGFKPSSVSKVIKRETAKKIKRRTKVKSR